MEVTEFDQRRTNSRADESVPLGYKPTEIGVLPEDWDDRQLASLVRGIYRGASPRPIDDPLWFDESSSVGWVRISDVTQAGRYLSETTQRLSRAGIKKSRFLPRGALIMSICATVGKPIETQVDVCIHDGFVVFEKPIVDQGFLYHSLKSLETGWSSKGQTGSQMNLNTKLIGVTRVPTPRSTVEQEAIAEALTDADALIESLSLLLAKKRQIKQGAMQELLTGKKRLPGFDAPWGKATIGSFTDCTAGGTPSTNIDAYWGGDIPWMSSGDLHLKHVKEVGGRITEEGLQSSSTKWIPPNCVLIGLAGQGKTRGTVAINHIPLCTNQSIAAIFPVDSYDFNFLYFNLDSRYEELRELSAGDGGRGGLNLNLVRGLKVPVPCLDEQRAIAQVLANLDSDIAAAEARLAKARDVKGGMMQKLLTGRIRLVQPVSNVIHLPSKAAKEKPSTTQAAHNWQINEAVVVGVLAHRFGSEKMPLGRKRRVKLMYLLHRYAEGRADGYLKKAAGPYDPNTKYKGPEAIALKNGYVRALRNGKYEGFVAGDKIEQAQRYFEQWYGADVLDWLERFHYRKTEDLELLATVDMAMVDLAASGKPAVVASVKGVIAANPEWLPKLSRELFSDDCIASAITECQALFSG